jgi:hypothetical protein
MESPLLSSADPAAADPYSEHSAARVFHNYASTDDRKLFASRVPTALTEEELKGLVEQAFEVQVEQVDLLTEKKEEGGAEKEADPEAEPGAEPSAEPAPEARVRVADESKRKKKKKKKEPAHLGHGYVLLASASDAQLVLSGAGTCRTAKKETIHFAPVVRKSRDDDAPAPKGVCFLWGKGRCTHGASCKYGRGAKR